MTIKEVKKFMELSLKFSEVSKKIPNISVTTMQYSQGRIDTLTYYIGLLDRMIREGEK